MSMVAAPSRPAFGEVEVVPMRPRHLRQVLDIEERVYPRPWSASLFSSELSRTDTRRYLVAVAPSTEGGGLLQRLLRRRQVVGYAGVTVQAGEEGLDAHITTVAVDPAEHRRKLATRLVAELLLAAIELGAKAATLEVRTANRGAQRLYEGFGFVSAGVRPRYYAETGEDALIMWARDIDSAAFRQGIAAQLARVDLPGGASGAPDHEVPWVEGRVGLEGER